MEASSQRIAVLGAGVVGLTVAGLIQQQLKNANVTVIAEKFNQDTTSFVAAGIFRPGLSFKGPTKEITQKWIDDSWHYWDRLLGSSEGPQAGVMPVSTYIFSKTNEHVTRNHSIEELVPIYRPVSEKELKLCGEGWKYGSYFSTLLVSTEKYLPWAAKRFVEKGGKITEKNIDSFTSLAGFDLVFNCTGLGAKYLCDDHDLVPIRGQVIKVKAPWLKSAFYGDYDAYIIPGVDGIATLGGTRQYDSYNLNVCRHDAAAIFERCCELVPALKDAEVVAHRVGLRPHRTPVRVEAEIGSEGLKMVHCYGHGGYGVTCAPGTAMHAVELGLQLLVKNKL